MRKIIKGLVLTGMFVACVFGMVLINIDAAILGSQASAEAAAPAGVVQNVQTPGVTNPPSTQTPSVEQPSTSAPTTEAPTTEAPKNGWVTEKDGRKYYINGKAKKGSHVAIKDKKNKVYYYSFDKNGNVVYGFVKVNGKIYYHSPDSKSHPGAAVTGWKTINGKKYYFSKKNYQAHIGLRKIGDARYFFDSKGKMVTKKWKTIKGKKYYFGSNGKAKTGLVKINGKKYYFDSKGVLIKNKFVKYKGQKYYVGKNGNTQTGLKKIKGNYYYFNKSGKMVKSAWVKTEKGKYYFTSSGKAYTGAHRIKKKLYVFQSNGTLVTKAGFVTVNGKTYYLDSKGAVATGYKKIDGSYYYFSANGTMYKKKWAYVNGYKFYFGSNGKRLVNVDSVLGKQDSYEIVVNKYSNVVTVYAKDGNKGYIIPVRAFICSTGESTPIGTFYTPTKYRWHELIGPCWGQWCTGIYEGFLFHSVYYNDVNNNQALSVNAYNKLGTTCSHGCVRLKAGDAKWIYDNCKLGTKVTIINKSGKDPFPKPSAYKLPSWHTWDPTDPNMQYKCRQNGCH